MSEEKIMLKRSWKHRFFIEILLSDAELELLASEIYSPGIDYKQEWLAQRGKVCLSGREDSVGLGAEINDVLALGFLVKAHLNGTQLDPSDSYWHSASIAVPKINSLDLTYETIEWEDQELSEWMDFDECPSVDDGDLC